jgi:hypothetical protein
MVDSGIEVRAMYSDTCCGLRGARLPMFCPEQTGCKDVANIHAGVHGRGNPGALGQCLCGAAT